jgi:hypothetical protein
LTKYRLGGTFNTQLENQSESATVITYQLNRKTNAEMVKLEGRIVGEIRPVTGGYQYFPKGQKEGGAIWPSLARCKQDVEGDGE